MASLFAFQFSTEAEPSGSIATALVFTTLAQAFGLMHCLKPAGTESLLTPEE